MGEKRDAKLITLIILAAVVFVILQLFTYLAGNPDYSFGLFLRGIGNVSDSFSLVFTPANETFSIWGVIYGWQILLLLYCLTSLCRSTSSGPVYTSPSLLTPSFYIFYIANNVSNITWLFLWDRLYFISSSVALFAISFTLYVCMAVSYRQLRHHITWLHAKGRKVEFWLVTIVVQNGVAVYAAWTTVAFLINLGVVLAYDIPNPVSPNIASLICLAILAAEILIYVGLDLTVLDKYAHYIFTPYLVLVAALVGILLKSWHPERPTSIFTAVLLAIAVLCSLVKFIRILVSCVLQNRKEGREIAI